MASKNLKESELPRHCCSKLCKFLLLVSLTLLVSLLLLVTRLLRAPLFIDDCG
jgi:hypothetical protein